MNENKIIYRKEYVENAIELLKQAHQELIETTERIDENIKGILKSNQFIYVERKDKSIKESRITQILRELEEETKNNIEFLETASFSMEEYAKDIEAPSTYQNPVTGSNPNPIVKNGAGIAALAGLSSVGISAFLASQEDKEKTEME